MSALQGPGESPPQVAGAARGYASDSDRYGDSPESEDKMRPPMTGKRNGSLSSNSVLAGGNDSSPQSQQFSSPEGVASGQSEQLPFFKDYYSADDIHPNDKVAVLWAYQPRAADEFELERGDMLKIVGIWDDGWATGVRINDRAEDYDGKHKAQRDSGVSNVSTARASSPLPTGEIKAFPLVCVCLPEAWRKTVEGDTSTDSGTGGAPDT
ncbi:putative sh3 domain-containing protein [Phaeomoniella chlamydospora]|uniref:Putative sh3 domain-containing protein n=1 Tax=Phaeomoniella chlamydospora TaxID=158046 RepID=A0A0G2F012_PHACM|nr:putative sh3 domain-containing protein [Phaeomoniella chlamydospora]